MVAGVWVVGGRVVVAPRGVPAAPVTQAETVGRGELQCVTGAGWRRGEQYGVVGKSARVDMPGRRRGGGEWGGAVPDIGRGYSKSQDLFVNAAALGDNVEGVGQRACSVLARTELFGGQGRNCAGVATRTCNDARAVSRGENGQQGGDGGKASGANAVDEAGGVTVAATALCVKHPDG